ncbi:MAG: glycosyltransferase family 2 protein [Bacteroidaceae bacterium]|nr:glycosyltransferase family 2 protein [Bacteroidaceae bacterium]
MRLSVIIVNYNVARFCEQAVCAVLASTVAAETEVLVVDNASGDDSVDYLRSRFPADRYPQVHLIAAPENLGFGRANNLAARRASGEYILFLNPDTLPAEDTLQRMLDFADEHPDLGALGVSMTNGDGTFAPESRRGLPTPWTAFCKMSGLCALFPMSRRFGRYYMAYLSPEKPHPSEVVSGACMMVRNDGRGDWFDPDYFMYGEDVDLSYRLMKAGKINYYLPAALVHYKGESTNKTGYRYASVFYGAMLIFLRKHFPVHALCLAPAVWLAILFKSASSRLHALWIDLRERFSRHGSDAQKERCLYLGTHPADVRRAAERYALCISVVEATDKTHPMGHETLDVAAFDHVIYDLADFPRAAVIRHLQATAGHLSLGLYDPASRSLITHGRQLQIPH